MAICMISSLLYGCYFYLAVGNLVMADAKGMTCVFLGAIRLFLLITVKRMVSTNIY